MRNAIVVIASVLTAALATKASAQSYDQYPGSWYLPYNPNNYTAIFNGTGPNGEGGSLNFFRQDGPASAPTAILAGAELGFIEGYGWEPSAGWNGYDIPPAVVFVASEDWSAGHHGVNTVIQGVANGASTGENEAQFGNGLVVSPLHYAQGRGVGTVYAEAGYFFPVLAAGSIACTSANDGEQVQFSGVRTPTYYAPIVSGGNKEVPAFCDGSTGTWRAH